MVAKRAEIIEKGMDMQASEDCCSYRIGIETMPVMGMRNTGMDSALLRKVLCVVPT